MERNSAALNQAMRKYYQSGLAAKQGTETEKYYMNTVSTEVILRQRSDLRRLSKREKKNKNLLLAKSVILSKGKVFLCIGH